MAASIRPMRRRNVQAEGPDRTGGISVRGRAGRREPASLRRISVFVPGEGLPYRVSRCENGACSAAPDLGGFTRAQIGLGYE
jgi:hypothetical protein